MIGRTSTAISMNTRQLMDQFPQLSRIMRSRGLQQESTSSQQVRYTRERSISGNLLARYVSSLFLAQEDILVSKQAAENAADSHIIAWRRQQHQRQQQQQKHVCASASSLYCHPHDAINATLPCSMDAELTAHILWVRCCSAAAVLTQAELTCICMWKLPQHQQHRAGSAAASMGDASVTVLRTVRACRYIGLLLCSRMCCMSNQHHQPVVCAVGCAEQRCKCRAQHCAGTLCV
jgi:hypothetical protein